jgi:hypothetical protein
MRIGFNYMYLLQNTIGVNVIFGGFIADTIILHEGGFALTEILKV